MAPVEQWTTQQIVEAFPWDEVPKYLIRDRDAIYGESFRRRIKHMGIRDVLIAFRSPWHSSYVEQIVGSIRRECLDHVIVPSQSHLERLLGQYIDEYYHVTWSGFIKAWMAPPLFRTTSPRFLPAPQN